MLDRQLSQLLLHLVNLLLQLLQRQLLILLVFDLKVDNIELLYSLLDPRDALPIPNMLVDHIDQRAFQIQALENSHNLSLIVQIVILFIDQLELLGLIGVMREEVEVASHEHQIMLVELAELPLLPVETFSVLDP